MPATVTLNDGRTVRLGRLRPKWIMDTGRFRFLGHHDGRVAVVANLAYHYDPDKDQAPPLAQVDYWTKAMPAVKQMDLNDTYGDCCLAMLDHSVGLWTGNELAAGPVMAVDSETLANYHDICGPGDNGCVVTDVMDAWVKGVKVGGGMHYIDSYVSIDWTNKALVQTVIEIFGTIQLGINLPRDWTSTNCVWGPSSGNVGGHCVPAGSFGSGLSDALGRPFNADGVSIATWAGLALIEWQEFLSKNWIEEAYVPLSKDWYANANLAPNGIDVASLQADIALLQKGQVPPIPDPMPPPVIINWTP